MAQDLDKVKRRLAQKASEFNRFMNSPIGRKVLRHLEKEFPGGIGKNPYDTYRKEGNREVVNYMKLMQEVHKKAEEGDLDS